MIIKQLKTSNAQPFIKAIKEVRKIMTSQDLSPLDKLYKMQSLSIMNHFEINC